jgi:hypothetical protein
MNVGCVPSPAASPATSTPTPTWETLYPDMADPTSLVTVTPPPDQRQRQAWLRTALGHYQTGVGVAELTLPDPFTGTRSDPRWTTGRSCAPYTAWPSACGGCNASTPPNRCCSTCCG